MEPTDEQTFDLSRMLTTNDVISVFQNGNWLECVSATGQRFRQGIPAGKILNKNEKGDWILQDLNLRG